MAEVVNLGAVCGRADRQRFRLLTLSHVQERGREGGCRRSRFHGMSKADRALAKSNTEKIRRELDEHRIETGEADEIAGR
jgi:hypothetical protein